MSYADHDILVDIIKDDWNEASHANACIRILAYIEGQNPAKLNYITLGSLKNVAGNTVNDFWLLRIVQYLCGERVKLLIMKFEFVENDESYDLSSDEVIMARASGVLVHPESGETIHDFKDKIFIYFAPARNCRESLTNE